MEFREALSKLKELEKEKRNTIKTLGKRKFFSFKTNDVTFIIINSKGNSFEIDKNKWDKIVNRYNEVPDNYKTEPKQYTATVWKENNPSTVFSPYAVALLRFICALENNEKDPFETLIRSYNFYKIGEYKLKDNEVFREVENSVIISQRKSLVYMLSINKKCMYIGKTIQGYSRPLNYHKNKVMKTVYEGIHQSVNSNIIEVYVLDKDLSMDYKDLKINIVEAVEQALISKYDPEWNNFKQ